MESKIKKYKVPIYVFTYASKVIGEIECDSFAEYKKKLNEFTEDGNFDTINVNITNDFEVGDTEIDEKVIQKKEDLQYYKQAKSEEK